MSEFSAKSSQGTVSLVLQIALLDADFVITRLRVGRREARVKDERISLSHGMIGQETNGAGGNLSRERIVSDGTRLQGR